MITVDSGFIQILDRDFGSWLLGSSTFPRKSHFLSFRCLLSRSGEEKGIVTHLSVTGPWLRNRIQWIFWADRWIQTLISADRWIYIHIFIPQLQNVCTNIGSTFPKLLAAAFTKEYVLHKIFNRNTVNWRSVTVACQTSNKTSTATTNPFYTRRPCRQDLFFFLKKVSTILSYYYCLLLLFICLWALQYDHSPKRPAISEAILGGPPFLKKSCHCSWTHIIK